MKSLDQIIDTMSTNMQESDLHLKTCPKCGTKKNIVVTIFGEKRVVPVMCKCEKEEYEKQKRLEEEKQKQYRIKRLFQNSLMDHSFRKCTFENWEMDEHNEMLYKIGIRYCENWQKMKRENIGLLLYGPPGTGKSYLSFCIANRLLENFVPVVAISTIGIINKIYQSYGKYGEEGETQIINSLKNASLLVLDDLGAEHNGPRGKEKQIIYSIIDSRVRDGKPMIITTNLTLEQLKEKLRGDDGVNRTYDRILGVCTPIQVSGPSRRAKAGKEKTEILKKLLSD